MHWGHRRRSLWILGLYSVGLGSGSKEIPLFDRRGPSFVSTHTANDSVCEESNGVAHNCGIDQVYEEQLQHQF
jgi:hypothetical protein